MGPDRPRGDDQAEEPAAAFRVIDRRRFAADGSDRAAPDEASPAAASGPGSGASGGETPATAGQEAASAESPGPPTGRAATATGATPDPAREPGSGGTAPEPAREARSAGPGEAAGLGHPVGDAYDADARLPIEPSFTTLVMSLSTQALLLLGEIQEPGEPAPSVDLPGARHLIDLLGVLQQKTAGNLDPSESQIMDRILYDLRMRFVEISRGVAR